MSTETGLTNLCDGGGCRHKLKPNWSLYMYPRPRITIQSNSELHCLRGCLVGKRYLLASIRAELCRILDIDFRAHLFYVVG